jgi:hypothetical protein
MSGEAGEHVGEPGLGIDVVELGRHDEAVQEGGALATTVGTGEQPSPAPQRKTTQCSFGGVVAEADPAIGKEAAEGGPSFEHVVHRSGDLAVPRQLAAFFAHPGFERGDPWRTLRLTDGEPLIGGQPIDAAFDIEQGVDACTASSAIGEMTGSVRPWARRRSPAATSASTKNLRRAWAQQAASRIGPGRRSTSYSLP